MYEIKTMTFVYDYLHSIGINIGELFLFLAFDPEGEK